MQYLTLDEIKKQLTIDADFHEDDEFLKMIGSSAEDFVQNLIDCPLDEVINDDGEVPAGIKHCLRMFCDYMYSQQRGSANESNDIPDAITKMLKLYRHYN